MKATSWSKGSKVAAPEVDRKLERAVTWAVGGMGRGLSAGPEVFGN